MRRADLDFVADLRGAALEGAGRGPALLLAVIAALVIAFLAWASVATLEEITYGGGRVIPASDVQQIQSLDGGILVELLVHEGDRVEKDQVLMRVDDTGFASNYNSNRAQHLGLQAAAARLEAELADATPVFPEALSLENPALVANETNLFHARAAELDSALNVLRRQVEQRQQELAEMQNRAERLKEGLALANKELGLLRPLVRQGAAAPMEELRLERAVNETQTTLETLRLTIPRLRSSITEAEQRIVEKKNGVRTAVLTELNDIKVKLSSTGEALKGLKDRVTRTDLRAPVAGLIKKIHQKTIGSVIQTGRTVIEIVPSEDTLMVEGRVRPADIAFLHPGQAARVKLTAYDFATYGALDGRLEHISADSTIDDKGESYYVIHVRTRADNVASGGKTLPIIPGMVADVSILTGKKTVMAYLLKPLTRGRDRLLTER